MILVDASVLFDHTRGRDPTLAVEFKRLPVAVCGITRTEAFKGARTPAERVDVEEALAEFAQVATPEAVWDALGDNLLALQRAGLTIPFPDALLATVGIITGHQVWARDRHFPKMQAVLPGLTLFPEPP